MPRLLCLATGVGDLDGGPVVALQGLVESDDALEAGHRRVPWLLAEANRAMT
jgi:hypothetical protein